MRGFNILNSTKSEKPEMEVHIMSTGWKTRFLFILFFLMGTGIGIAGVTYKLFDISTGIQRNVPTSGRVEIEMYRHEIRAFVFRGIFYKRNNPVNLIWIKQYTDKPHYKLPRFVENWNDQFDTLYASLDSLENTFVIRPLGKDSVTVDSFRIEAGIRHGLYPTDEKMACYLTVIVRLKDPPFLPPTVIPEPSFTRGTQNTIRWIPSSGATTQDVYCFDTLDSLNLYKSIRRLYRVSSGDTLTAQFEGLQDGHRYGYFAKAVFGTGFNAITLYSDFTYSIQDNSPPPPVIHAQAVVQGSHTVEISWETVEDGGSGTALYRIYQSLDTGPEVLVDSVIAPCPQPKFLTYSHWVPLRVGSHYRVTAVDGVGNEGEGVRTNPVFSGFNRMDSTFVGGSETSSSQDQISFSLFLRGVVDTLRVPVTGQEKALRFQVVRDSLSFFDSPPSIGGRFFDSGWIPLAQVPDDPKLSHTKFYVFDYTQGGLIPASFVNGHRYIRKVRFQYLASTKDTLLGEKIPDAFPPEDVRNVKLQAILTEPSSYSHWHFLLTWEASHDAVSGLKRYHIFRKIGAEPFTEIPLSPQEFLKTYFIDKFEKVSSSLNNPLVFYRIVAEDNVGNCRDIAEVHWEAKDRALGAPLLDFAGLHSSDVKLKGVDTLYTRKGTVLFQLNRFDLSDVDHFIVSLNGIETVYPKPPTDTLSILLPAEEKIEIRIRAVYLGGRSSVWSNSKIVIRTSNVPIQEVSAWIDTSYWGGHIYLRWRRPSLDTKSYEIWRWSTIDSPRMVGILESDGEEVQWTDFYALDERAGKPGDTLWAYQIYFYAIRKINLFDEVTSYSDTVSAWCNKPPTIQKKYDVGIENGKPVIRIRWRRALPTTVPYDFTIGVKVYRDSLDHLIAYDTIADDDSIYTFRAVEFGHNFIFRIQEIPNRDPQGRRSSWSSPFTVSLKQLPMDVLAQPKGKIFIHWNTSIVDSFKVNAFLITRKSSNDSFETRVSPSISSYMDMDSRLIHGKWYRYYVMALDSLDQVVAANQAEVVCDHGAAYIPDVEDFKMKYFNSDSICVKWLWRDVQGKALENNTRGAKLLLIQVSVSKFFPDDTLQTLTIGPFSADPLHRMRWVRIPKLGNRENANIYCRMTAKDSWGNPTESIWSTDFYPVRTVTFDPVPPKAVGEVLPKSVHAYPAFSNTVIHTLYWSGKGVEWSENDQGKIWDKLDTNVAFYELWRMAETGGTVFVRRVPVHHLREGYTVQDTTVNGKYRWKVISVDSAGNRTEGTWSGLSPFLSTPSSPMPFSSRGCQIVPLENLSNVEYFVEMASMKNHFRLAYEMDRDGFLDSLLCQSGWTKNLQFECTTGWGRVVRDTTWFRVKARIREDIESGWSEPVPYIISNTPNLSLRTSGKAVCELGPNYPNPFNPTTTIPYQLMERSRVLLSVYNVLGARVRMLVDDEREPGEYRETWDATDEKGIPMASGIYFAVLRIETEKGEVLHRRVKMILMR